MGGQGVSEYEREALILSSSPGDPLGTFPSLGKYLAPQGETLLAPLQEYRAEKERRGHTPGWLLSAFGRFTFSPRPTGFF